jgi:hypothetical protein
MDLGHNSIGVWKKNLNYKAHMLIAKRQIIFEFERWKF